MRIVGSDKLYVGFEFYSKKTELSLVMGIERTSCRFIYMEYTLVCVYMYVMASLAMTYYWSYHLSRSSFYDC